MVTFSKYHGCGNDFIIVEEKDVFGADYSELAKKVCHRKVGIGADGFIVVRKTQANVKAEAEERLEMVFFNSDGSRAPMCGNGIRCFAKYCYDEKICTQNVYKVETLAGMMSVNVLSTEPFQVEINMGKPKFHPRDFGVTINKSQFINERIQVDEEYITVSSCFMGTVHTVVWINEMQHLKYGKGISFEEGTELYENLRELGKTIESYPIYGEKTNVNMVEVINENTLRLQTYERGVGMTAACGTGACASLVIGALIGKCQNEVDVILPFGKLHITEKDGDIFMRGPAEFICRGTFSLF